MERYIGTNPQDLINDYAAKKFYGLRRTDNGELFIAKMDIAAKNDSIEINKNGDPTQNYPNFEEGQDFYEGRDVNHNLVYDNLNYEQLRWDTRNISYYVNEEGELVARINHSFTYDENSSSDGL